ncbi:MAG: hypothetical protein ACSLEN_06425 [Candidatus Malihini olakiniferum]
MYFILPLKPTRLIKRYKRFLADVVTPRRDLHTALCQYGCNDRMRKPCDTVWYSTPDNPKRKYAYS